MSLSPEKDFAYPKDKVNLAASGLERKHEQWSHSWPNIRSREALLCRGVYILFWVRWFQRYLIFLFHSLVVSLALFLYVQWGPEVKRDSWVQLTSEWQWDLTCHGAQHLLFPVPAVHGELPVESTRSFMDTSKEILGGCVEAVSWMTDEGRVGPHWTLVLKGKS